MQHCIKMIVGGMHFSTNDPPDTSMFSCVGSSISAKRKDICTNTSETVSLVK